jgi:hypothetical protein
MYTLFFISFFTTLALNVSGTICTHHQEQIAPETFRANVVKNEIKNIVYI